MSPPIPPSSGPPVGSGAATPYVRPGARAHLTVADLSEILTRLMVEGRAWWPVCVGDIDAPLIATDPAVVIR